MITENGSRHIKRYLMGAVGGIGRSLALGVGNSTESPLDTTLDYEIIRADVTLTTYDFVNDRLVFKATLPDSISGIIREVGLWSLGSNQININQQSRNVVTFDPGVEAWIGGTYSDLYTRIGAQSMTQTAPVSANTVNTLTEVLLDLSGHSGADEFVFAFHVADGNNNGLSYRFMTDASNYYEFTFPAQAEGYQIVRAPKASATVTGVPTWSNITQLQITSTAGAAGAGTVHFDGIRIEDVDTPNPGYVMVAREVLETPYVKVLGQPQDIEFSLLVNI